MHGSCHSSVPESVFYEEASGIMVDGNRQSRAYFQVNSLRARWFWGQR